MGIGGKELLIILAIGLVIFGAKRIRHIGEGLGQSMKDFRNSLREDDHE
jgi:sec-independent protein translocase protein TatA